MEISIDLYWIVISSVIILMGLAYKLYTKIYPELPVEELAQLVLDELKTDNWNIISYSGNIAPDLQNDNFYIVLRNYDYPDIYYFDNDKKTKIEIEINYTEQSLIHKAAWATYQRVNENKIIADKIKNQEEKNKLVKMLKEKIAKKEV